MTVNGDLIDEPAAETFLIHLSNSTGPVILDGDAIGTINDNDTATVVINNVTVPEGNSGTTDAIFTVSLNTPYYRDFTVDWATAAGPHQPRHRGRRLPRGVGYGDVHGRDHQPDRGGAGGGRPCSTSRTRPSASCCRAAPGPTISDSRGDGTITDDDTLTIDVADV